MGVQGNEDLQIVCQGATEPGSGNLKQEQHVATAPKPTRLYWMDWLRVFLMVLVLLHHCVNVYGEPSSFWWVQASKQDGVSQLLNSFFAGANQSYFMGLFFLLAGYCTPGSYRRKRPWRFLLDRTLRLMLPTIVYSLTFPSLIYWINATAAQPSPAPTLAAVFKEGMKRFQVGDGPTWFLYTLWWFSVAYMIVSMINSTKCGQRCRQLLDKCRPKQATTTAQESSKDQVFPLCWTLKLGALLIVVLTGVAFISRVAGAAAGLRPYSWVRPAPVVGIMYDYIGQYAIAFSLGVLAAGHNALRRLPSSCGWWCLVIAGIWWTEAGFLAFEHMQPPLSSWHPLPWLYHTFVEQSFAVVWSIGLLVVFRDTFNNKPGKVGAQVVGAAYGAYLVHPLLLSLFAWALMPIPFATPLFNVLAISPMVVISAWMVAAAMKAVPGAGHVL